MALRHARRAQGRSRRGSLPRHASRARHRVPGASFGRATRDRGALVRGRGRGDAQPGRRHRCRALPRRGPQRAHALHAGGADRGHHGRRDGADPLHVGDDEGSEGRRPHARVHVGAAHAGEPLARRARERRRLVHGRHRLGEGDLERPPRAVVARRRGRPPRGCVRAGGTSRAAPEARRHRPLPGADRVPDAREARRPRRDVPAAAAPRRLGGRAAQPRGDRAVPGRARADDLRRLRADGELAARREHRRDADPTGLDGPPDPRATTSR